MTKPTSAPPYFPFYVDDFLGGTVDMSPEEVGCYIRLLAYQWNKGHLPGESSHNRASTEPGGSVQLRFDAGHSPAQAVRLARIAGGPVSEHVLSKFDVCPDGLLRNSRLESVRSKMLAYRHSQSEKGRASAASRGLVGGVASTEPQPSLDRASTEPATERQPSTSTSTSTSTSDEVKSFKGKSAGRDGVDRYDDSEIGVLRRLAFLIGDSALANDGGKWRKRFRVSPASRSKVLRVVAACECDLREGKTVRSWAAYAEDIWKRFAL